MKHLRPLMFAALAALAVLGCSDTASAQPVLTVTPATTASNPLAFTNIPAGGVSLAQNVHGVHHEFDQHHRDRPGQPGLAVADSDPRRQRERPGHAQRRVQYERAHGWELQRLIYDFRQRRFAPRSGDGLRQPERRGNLEISSNPTSLAFSAQEGASTATPNGIQVQILTSGPTLNYTLQAQTENGGNWLLLSAQSGSTAGAPFTVSVNPSGLYASTFPAVFNGIITVTSVTTATITTTYAVQIPVQVTLTATAELTVAPAAPPPFLYQAGTAADPASQQLSVSSAGGSTAFTIAESPAVSWLVLSALGGTAGTTPDIITMNATPVQNDLQAGTYTTSLIVTPSGEAALPAVPVSLVVAAHPLLQLSTNNLAFTASFAGSPPSAQSVTVTSSAGASGPVGFSITSSETWLTVTPTTGTTPAALTVQVNPSGLLTTQTYSGTLTISPTNGDPYSETITVSLAINAAATLEAGPGESLVQL